MSNYRTLREFKEPFMEIECANCDRRGRYKVSRLIEKWGADMPISTFIASLGMTCPKYVKASKFDPCGIICPQLACMFEKPSGVAAPRVAQPRSAEGSPE